MEKGKQKQRRSKIMWCVLPNEIEENILSRLPVKSLMRFRCVCKHWCNFVTNPHFIKMQFNRSIQIKESPKLIRANGNKVYYIDVEACGNQCIKTRGQKKNLERELVLPFSDNIWNSSILHVSGSCNGLLCLSVLDRSNSMNHALYLLNPATKEYKRLCYPQGILFSRFMWFGYSPRTDEYKVMIIGRFRIKNYAPLYNVYVYTLGRNSSWRSVGGTDYRIRYPLHQALVNGALHWMAASDTPVISIVPISFDLGDEKFRELSLPKSFSQEDTTSSHHSMEFVELGGCLSLYHQKDDKKFEIWVMKDYADEQSWTKVFSVAQPILSGIEGSVRPLYILKKDEVVLCESECGLFILDVVEKQIRKLHIRNPKYDYGEEMYWESLVSLKAIVEMDRGNKQERRDKEGGRLAVEGTCD